MSDGIGTQLHELINAGKMREYISLRQTALDQGVDPLCWKRLNRVTGTGWRWKNVSAFERPRQHTCTSKLARAYKSSGQPSTPSA